MKAGDKYGRLTVQEIVGKNAVCLCECGNKQVAYCNYLEKGLVKSCGCLQKETSSKKFEAIGEKEREKAKDTKEELYRIDEAQVFSLKRKRNKNNSTGVKGVYRHGEKYVASIQLKGKSYYLGLFPDLDKAKQARAEAEKKYFSPIIEKWEECKNG